MGWWVHPPLPFSPRKSPPVHEYSSDPALHFNLASCSGGIKNVSWRLVLFWLESRRLAGRAVGRLVMLSCHRGLTVVSPWSATLPPHQFPVPPPLTQPQTPAGCGHRPSTPGRAGHVATNTLPQPHHRGQLALGCSGYTVRAKHSPDTAHSYGGDIFLITQE